MRNKKVKEQFTTIVFIFVSMFGASQAYAQENRLTLDKIIEYLLVFSPTPETRAAGNKTLSKEIGKNGVSFVLDAGKESILRQNGADDNLILAIKKSAADKKSPAAGKKIAKKQTVSEKSEKPIDAAGYLKRAEACNQYDYDCQIKNYDRAINLDSRNAAAYWLRGNAYRWKNNYEQAFTDYAKAIEIEPKFFDAYRSRSLAYEAKGELAKAIADASQALQIKPDDAYVYNHRGNLYRYLLEYEKAIADYSKAIEFAPDNLYYYEDRANAYRDAGKCDAAIADYLKRLAPTKKPLVGNQITYSNLGRCYGETGQYKSAIDSYTKAIEIEPGHEGAYKNRSEMYEKIGETEKAKADRRKYQELMDAFTKRIFEEND